jgi:hypothetical protein
MGVIDRPQTDRTERSGNLHRRPFFSGCRHAIVVCAWERVIEQALAT